MDLHVRRRLGILIWWRMRQVVQEEVELIYKITSWSVIGVALFMAGALAFILFREFNFGTIH